MSLRLDVVSGNHHRWRMSCCNHGRWQQRLGLEWAFGFTALQSQKVDGRWIQEPDNLHNDVMIIMWSVVTRKVTKR